MRPLSSSWLWRQSTSLKWVLPCNLFKQIHLSFNLEFLLKPGDRCWRCCSFIFASCHKISAESEKQRACRRIPGPVPSMCRYERLKVRASSEQQQQHEPHADWNRKQWCHLYKTKRRIKTFPSNTWMPNYREKHLGSRERCSYEESNPYL